MQTHVTTQPEINDLDELFTVDGLIKEYPDKFTNSQIRWALRYREENGLSDAVVKFGKRIYLHRPSFIRWLSRQQ